MTLEQRRQIIDTSQVWDAWTAARRRSRSYLGSMGWKRQNGQDYLVRQFSEGRARKARSLGPRSPETERVLEEFTAGKLAAKDAVKRTGARLDLFARLNRALGLARVPLPAAKIARALERAGLLGSKLFIIGTNAVFAYEAAAGVFVESAILATGDLDFLLDARAVLRLTAEGEVPSLIDILREVDRSFEPVQRQGFRAVNADGYYVDLVKAPPSDVIFSKEPDSLGGEYDLQASHVPNMRWIANAPRFTATCIGADGYPVPMACPDPRAFALYKLWMGTRDVTREPAKRARDIAQAYAVAEIVNGHLPGLPFEPEHLSCFPLRVAQLGEEAALYRSGIRI
jgi:hypothetical protein